MTTREKIQEKVHDWAFTPANCAILCTLLCGIGTAVWQAARAIDRLDTLIVMSADHEERLRDLEADHSTRRKVADR